MISRRENEVGSFRKGTEVQTFCMDGLGHSSVAQRVPGMSEALGLVPSTAPLKVRDFIWRLGLRMRSLGSELADFSSWSTGRSADEVTFKTGQAWTVTSPRAAHPSSGLSAFRSWPTCAGNELTATSPTLSCRRAGTERSAAR